MNYVYLLRSVTDSAHTYVGYTADLRARLAIHNTGGSRHTEKYRPWSLETYLAFSDKHQALEFERYLKSHSGQAFASKRLWRRKNRLQVQRELPAHAPKLTAPAPR